MIDLRTLSVLLLALIGWIGQAGAVMLTTGDVVYYDSGKRALIKADATTGITSFISGYTIAGTSGLIGSGPTFPFGAVNGDVSVDGSGNIYFAPGGSLGDPLLRVDPVTGDRDAFVTFANGVLSGSNTAIAVVPNGLPIADAGAPYFLTDGGSLTLDGSLSSDPNGAIVDYQWDLDFDGNTDFTFSVPLGVISQAQYDGLFSIGVNTIGLRVMDSFGAFDFATATLQFSAQQDAAIPEPSTLILCAACLICALVSRSVCWAAAETRNSC